ncbi:MAG: winged helix-turn-helix domain-containing protein [archaeon]|jgi:predicted transcriptional regulator
MDERVVLDERSFKALSADSRVNILKNLTDRRRTLTELSQKLNLGNSTIKEHCDILVNAELIKQMDEGRKWKYYELTSKGRQIIKPNVLDEVKVLILLSFATIIVGGFVFMILAGLNMGASTTLTSNVQDRLLQKSVMATTENTALTAAPMLTQTAEGISTEFFIASIMISLILGMFMGWIFTRKR